MAAPTLQTSSLLNNQPHLRLRGSILRGSLTKHFHLSCTYFYLPFPMPREVSCKVVTLWDAKIPTAEQTCNEHLCQISHNDILPHGYICAISRFSVANNIHMQPKRGSYVGSDCLQVLLCSSAVSLWHLSPEGTSNPITDLHKVNDSKASIPLVLRPQREQKSLLSTFQELQKDQQSQYLKKFPEFKIFNCAWPSRRPEPNT